MNFDRAAVVTNKRGAGWFRAMSLEIFRALERHGVRAHLVDAENLPAFWSNGPGSGRNTIYIDFNKRVTYPDRRPAISVMVDHPCSLVKELAAEQSTDAVTGWVDASHIEAVKALGFAHRAVFLPHAGPDAAERVPGMAEREIDIFFAGSLDEQLLPSATAHTGLSFDPSALMFETIGLIERTGMPVLPAVLQIMRQLGVATSSLTRGDFAQLMTSILSAGETNRRLNVLTALPDDVTVAVASKYLPAALRDRPNIRHLGHIDDFDQIRALMRNSRIVLNTTAKFPVGSHERIWYAMAEGALVLTDSSVFMKQDFADGENILYLPQKHLDHDDLAPLTALARDHGKLARMTESATARYRERHSWGKRVPYLIEAMRAA